METFFVACAQGHKLKAKSTLIGKVLPCPKCGAQVLIEAPQDAGDEELTPLEADPLGTPAAEGDPLGLGGYDLNSLPAANAFPAGAVPHEMPSSFAHPGMAGRPAMPPGAYGAAPAPAGSTPTVDKKLWLILGGAAAGLFLFVGVVIAVAAAIRAGREAEPSATTGVAATSPSPDATSPSGAPPAAASSPTDSDAFPPKHVP